MKIPCGLIAREAAHSATASQGRSRSRKYTPPTARLAHIASIWPYHEALIATVGSSTVTSAAAIGIRRPGNFNPTILYGNRGRSSAPLAEPSRSRSAGETTASPGAGMLVSPGGTGACRVSNAVSAWNTGLTNNITITNTGTAAINGWTLTFTLASGQTIVSGWSATYSPSSGAVTATNAGYNGSLPAGGSATIGYQATHTGNAAAPTGFKLNGSTCS